MEGNNGDSNFQSHMWLTHDPIIMGKLERMEWMGSILTIKCGTHHPPRVRSLLHDQRDTMLIENGNMHQFIGEELARRMEPNKAGFEGFTVTITYGAYTLYTRKIPQLAIPMKRYEFCIDFLVLSSAEEPMGFGVQELQTLGKEIFKIRKKGLKFHPPNEEVRIFEISYGKGSHVKQGKSDFISLPAVERGLILAKNAKRNVANNIIRRIKNEGKMKHSHWSNHAHTCAKKEGTLLTYFRMDITADCIFSVPLEPFSVSTTYQSYVDLIFGKYLKEFVLVSFDDVLRYSKAWVKHLQHLNIIMSALGQQSLQRNLNVDLVGAKCWTKGIS
ncbi:hypothetical protein KI387_041748 [Taxus chinensis]|uniref:Uncharacterized protein n=1 Tax=Taxus chinensis TaxID=29808 RepID=A0AA38C5X9_TAXCH|nr:hypothetical protein KI387_041748 [Taxus chinensis]